MKLINQVQIAPGRSTLVDVESGGEVFGLIVQIMMIRIFFITFSLRRVAKQNHKI